KKPTPRGGNRPAPVTTREWAGARPRPAGGPVTRPSRGDDPMNDTGSRQSRRAFLGAVTALGASAYTVRGAFAEALARTPRLTERPFSPDRLPPDPDNDLLRVNDSIPPAVGEVTHLTGRVLSPSGEPLRGAVVEIWQVDGKGVYLHSADSA